MDYTFETKNSTNLFTGNFSERSQRHMTMPKPAHHLGAPHPHEKRTGMQLRFEDKDWEVFLAVFGDVDSAEAAMNTICTAPPEIQILAMQVLKMIEEVA